MRKTCLDWVHKLAKEDPRVVFVGSDLSPGLLSEMKKEMPDRWFMDASLNWNGPIYIRLAKGGDPIVSRPEHGFEIGKAIVMRKSRERTPVVMMTTGVMTTNALKAADLLEADGIDASVVHFHTIK